MTEAFESLSLHASHLCLSVVVLKSTSTWPFGHCGCGGCCAAGLGGAAARGWQLCAPRGRRGQPRSLPGSADPLPLDDPAGAWAGPSGLNQKWSNNAKKHGVACVEVSHRLAVGGITHQRAPTHDGDIFPLASGSLHHASAGPPHGGLGSASHNSLPKRGKLAQASFLDGDSAAAVDWAGPSDLPSFIGLPPY